MGKNPAFFVFCGILLFPIGSFSEERHLRQPQFISHDAPGFARELSSAERQAIEKSRKSLSHFRHAFENRRRGHWDFCVVAPVMNPETGSWIPVGILVESIDDDEIRGKEVVNRLHLEVSRTVQCNLQCVIDWRYTDLCQLVGGSLYRELLESQPLHIKRTVLEAQSFVIGWDWTRNDSWHQLLQNIGHDNQTVILEIIRREPELLTRIGPVPVRQHKVSLRWRATIREISTPQYAAHFGSQAAIEALGRVGELANLPDLLTDSAYAGNVQSAGGILALGCDIDGRDSHGATALHVATTFDQEEMVAFLLKRGANCNVFNPRKQTPLFAARSRSVAKKLVDAGANLQHLDDNGQNCVQVHLQDGQFDVARFLNEVRVRRGLPTEDLQGSVETIVDGATEIIEYFNSQGDMKSADRLREVFSINYGCVLPITSFPWRSTPNSNKK